MGLTPHEYYCLSRAEFFIKSKGFNTARWKEWEHTRQISYMVRAGIKTKEHLPKMTKWMPLPTDRVEEIDHGKMKKMFEKLKAKQNGN